MTIQDLPAINASLNGTATVLLILGIVAIKREAKRAHGLFMGAAFVVSSLFLVLYLIHKYLLQSVHTPFGGTGIWKTVYYTMLISHIILAITVPFLAITTIRLALKAKFEQHRALAKWTFPIWLYVSVTGVLVYFFLYVWFPTAKPETSKPTTTAINVPIAAPL
jgi:putative membrane protein